ncbi:MAG: hypothetical protein ACRD6X_17220, partial [Pyrinomonadaceae bacterium]
MPATLWYGYILPVRPEPQWLIIRNTQNAILVMSSTFMIGSDRHSRSYAFQMFQMFHPFQAFHLFQTFHRNIDAPRRNETLGAVGRLPYK